MSNCAFAKDSTDFFRPVKGTEGRKFYDGTVSRTVIAGHKQTIIRFEEILAHLAKTFRAFEALRG